MQKPWSKSSVQKLVSHDRTGMLRNKIGVQKVACIGHCIELERCAKTKQVEMIACTDRLRNRRGLNYGSYTSLL